MKKLTKTDPQTSKKVKFITILFLIFNLACINVYAQMDEACKLYNRSNALVHAKKYAEAVAEYDKGIALNPKMQYVYGQRGNTYHQLKKFDKAIEDYKKDEIAYPAHSSYNMACALSILGKKRCFKMVGKSTKVRISSVAGNSRS